MWAKLAARTGQVGPDPAPFLIETVTRVAGRSSEHFSAVFEVPVALKSSAKKGSEILHLPIFDELKLAIAAQGGFCDGLGIYDRREHFLSLRRETGEVVFFDFVDEFAEACTTLVSGGSGEPDEKFFLGIVCPSLQSVS